MIISIVVRLTFNQLNTLFSALAWSFGAFSIDDILVYTVAYAQLKIQLKI